MTSETAIVTLAKAIGYPEVVPDGVASFSFAADGSKVEAEVVGSRLVLKRRLATSESVDLAQLCGYAAGRVLKEDAVLAYDPTGDEVILWQDVAASAPAEILRRFFEVFLVSCDWWQARVQGASVATTIPEMMIRP